MMAVEVDVQIQDRSVGNVVVIELAGRLTVTEQPGLLRRAVEDALGRGARDVVVDLTGVHYLDSTSLGELMAAHITASRLGSRLKLAATPPRIEHLLRLAGLDGVFERFESVEAATDSLQAL